MKLENSRCLRTLRSGAVLLLPLTARAQSTNFQQDPVDYYGSLFLTAVMVLGIVVVLYSLIRYRGRASSPLAWGLLIAGAGILPAVSSAFGTVLVFERAEKVEFCASCHLTMQSFVTDLKNPDSESLAAVHYKNRYIPDDQCYVCHTSYGVFGTVQAKKEGMIDVYKYFTRTFKLPVKLRHPYPNNDCLKCHAESAKWRAIHDDFKQTLFSGEMTCMECHGAEHPAHTLAQVQ